MNAKRILGSLAIAAFLLGMGIFMSTVNGPATQADIVGDIHVDDLEVDTIVDFNNFTSCLRLPTDANGLVSCGTSYTWTDLASYPASCAANEFVRQIDDALTCSSTVGGNAIVGGPGSSTDNAIARWNGTGGNTLQNSAAILDDTGGITLGSDTDPKNTKTWLASSDNRFKLSVNTLGQDTVFQFSPAAEPYPGSIVAEGVEYIKLDTTGDNIVMQKTFSATAGGSFSGTVQVNAGSVFRFASSAPGGFLQFNPGTTTPAGTTCPGTATEIDDIYTRLTTVTGSDAAVKLPACTSPFGEQFWIWNDDAADAATVCPTSGGNIGAGTNTGITLPAGARMHCMCNAASTAQCTIDDQEPAELPAYANISVVDNASSTSVASSATEYQITVFDTNGPSAIDTPDHTNDHITVTNAGDYLIVVSMSVDSAAGTAFILECQVYKNNGATALTGFKADEDFASGGGEIQSMDMNGIATLSASDTIEVWCENETNTTDFTVVDASMSIHRLS